LDDPFASHLSDSIAAGIAIYGFKEPVFFKDLATVFAWGKLGPDHTVGISGKYVASLLASSAYFLKFSLVLSLRNLSIGRAARARVARTPEKRGEKRKKAIIGKIQALSAFLFIS
jgi:hypothetical protein